MSGRDAERSILEHIGELRTRLVRALISITIISLFAFAFSITDYTIGGVTIPLPYPDLYENIASNVISDLRQLILPSYVELIITTPGQAVLAQLYTSLMIGVLFSIPIIVVEVASFVGPGLYPAEKRMVRNLVIPATLLFAAGALFALFFLLPFTMDFLYRYGVALGAETFITLDQLITFVLFFTMAFGLSFQLPIVMWILTRLGVVERRFWLANWRYVFIGLVIFGAVITPDASGVTMWFITLPMMGLYIVGYVSTRFIKAKGRGLNK